MTKKSGRSSSVFSAILIPAAYSREYDLLWLGAAALLVWWAVARADYAAQTVLVVVADLLIATELWRTLGSIAPPERIRIDQLLQVSVYRQGRWSAVKLLPGSLVLSGWARLLVRTASDSRCVVYVFRSANRQQWHRLTLVRLWSRSGER